MFESSAAADTPYDGQAFATSTRGLLLVGTGSFLILALPEALKRLVAFDLTPGLSWLPLCLACVGSFLFVICGYSYLSPVTMVVDADGFVLKGALTKPNSSQRWSEIERFSVVSTNYGARVACLLKPGTECHFRSDENVPGFGCVMSGFQPHRPEDVVPQLNAAMARASGVPAHSTFEGVPRSTRGMVDRETIEGSRLRYIYSVAGFVLPTFIVPWIHGSGGLSALACLLVIFSPIMARYLWLALNPPTLTLDAQGISLPGGLLSAGKSVAWADIQDFVTIIPQRGILEDLGGSDIS